MTVIEEADDLDDLEEYDDEEEEGDEELYGRYSSYDYECGDEIDDYCDPRDPYDIEYDR